MTNQELHLKTKSIARRYLQIEAELVTLLIEMDSRRAFKDLGYASLFQYCVLELGLSEAVTSAFITVSRKAAQVPDSMLALEEQTLTVSKAAKISSALDIQCSSDNKQVIEFASTHSTAETERWLREKKGVETTHTFKLSSKIMEKLKHARSLNKEALSLEEALESALDEYIQKHDPLEKAKRAESRTQKQTLQNTGYPVLKNTTKSPVNTKPIGSRMALNSPKRTPIPASIKHQVIASAKNQCTHEIQPGFRCGNRKYLEIHHLNPVHAGGTNAFENLTLLCSAHHQQLHAGPS